jgi:hypothetical protein
MALEKLKLDVGRAGLNEKLEATELAAELAEDERAEVRSLALFLSANSKSKLKSLASAPVHGELKGFAITRYLSFCCSWRAFLVI